jgi:Tol biopolymer transport system component
MTYENGLKQGPSLSPDGRDLVYAAQPGPAGLFHIYLRHLDGSGMPMDLSRESTGSDITPAFAPDGLTIAFASSREDSQGIFVMSRSGESVRRLSNGGFDPSWTPDGREIVYSTESGRTPGSPDARQAPSELWAVNVHTGARRRIATTDAVDPHVSPDGRFVAFWALEVDASGTQFSSPNRDIWIQPMAGGPRIQVSALNRAIGILRGRPTDVSCSSRAIAAAR